MSWPPRFSVSKYFETVGGSLKQCLLFCMSVQALVLRMWLHLYTCLWEAEHWAVTDRWTHAISRLASHSSNVAICGHCMFSLIYLFLSSSAKVTNPVYMCNWSISNTVSKMNGIFNMIVKQFDGFYFCPLHTIDQLCHTIIIYKKISNLTTKHYLYSTCDCLYYGIY